MPLETDPINPKPKKVMSTMGKTVNLLVQFLLLIITVYIIARTVESVGIKLFTWHPVFISLGVSIPYLPKLT